MTLSNILSFAHSLLSETVQSGDHAIDCTVGNGHDTVFLATLVGSDGHVFGYDIQKEAITKTKERLVAHHLKDRVTLFQTSHDQLISTIPKNSTQKLKAAIFNLGYLPGGDKRIVTKSTSTIRAIEQALELIQPNGLVILVIYPGHEEGRQEKEDVLTFVNQIDQRKAKVLRYEFINQMNHPPFIIAIEKIKQSLNEPI